MALVEVNRWPNCALRARPPHDVLYHLDDKTCAERRSMCTRACAYMRSCSFESIATRCFCAVGTLAAVVGTVSLMRAMSSSPALVGGPQCLALYFARRCLYHGPWTRGHARRGWSRARMHGCDAVRRATSRWRHGASWARPLVRMDPSQPPHFPLACRRGQPRPSSKWHARQ